MGIVLQVENGKRTMCAIAGFVHIDTDQRRSREVVQRMTDVVVHRGLDEEGSFSLGRSRWGIADCPSSTSGRDSKQCNTDDRSLVITYNGEIYNYVELREELRTICPE